MKTIIKPQSEIEVLDDVDVIIVGGGPAGIGAALASGRNGAKTILIEAFGSLGGLQTQGNNSIFSFIDPELHRGIFQEIFSKLKEAGAVKNLDDLQASERARMKYRILEIVDKKILPKRFIDTEVGYWGIWGIPFDCESYKFLTETMLQEAGVKILYHALATDVIREENEIKGIIIESSEGSNVILDKSVIDCTGIGHIIWKSGAPCLGDEGYPVGKHKG